MPAAKTAKLHERKPGPYSRDRRCSCGAKLSSYNPHPELCAPCAGGDWISPEASETEILQLRAARLEELGLAA